MRVGLVTCATLPEPDPDQEPLLAALAEAGVDAALLAWDDPRADPGAFDLCVLRSTWNYYEDPEAFSRWIQKAEQVTRLRNPGDAVRWNLHKGYLRELDAAGVEGVPTAWVARGESASLAARMEKEGWNDVVVKPAVSAGSFRTRRFRAGELSEGQAFLDGLVADRDAMIQPYLSAVERGGERALVWIDGAFTHAVQKRPRFAGADEQVSDALALRPAERELGEKVIALVEADLLYGRVDLIEGADGRPRLAELEITEPSLFLVQHPPAMHRFVQAIVELARR